MVSTRGERRRNVFVRLDLGTGWGFKKHLSDTVEARARVRWGPIFLWATSVYCFIAALALAVGAHFGRLPGHDLNQIVPVLIHLLFNGVSLAALAWPLRPSSLISGLLRMGGLMFGLVFGLIGLALGVQALFGLTVLNAPALLLAVPGAALIAILLPGYIRIRRSYPSVKALEEIPPPSLVSAVIISVGFSIYAVLLLGAVKLAPFWFTALKSVLWTKTRYGAVDFTQAIIALTRHFPALVALGVSLLVTASVAWTLLRQRLRKPLSKEQREVVRSRLRALWDYANAPDQKSRTVATWILPLILATGVYVMAIVLPAHVDEFVQGFAPPSKAVAAQSWYFFVRDEDVALLIAFLFSLFAGMALAFSIYRLCVDLWPRALQGELVSSLRQGSFRRTSVDSYRRALEKEVWRGKTSAFAPRAFLLNLRMRVSWRTYLATLSLVLVSAAVVWRCINSYTIATDSGLEVAPFLSIEEHHYRYVDVARVRIDCHRYSYEVEFRDGRSAELWGRSPTSFESIARVDRHLRESGAKFVVVVDKRGVPGVRQCVSSLAQYYGNADVLTRIMHQE